MKAISVNRENRKQAALIGYDLEWTKNYRIKNGNRAFCFSFVTIDKEAAVDESLKFGVEARYAETESEAHRIVIETERILKKLAGKRNVKIIGHQLSSDISVLIQNQPRPMPSIMALRESWHARKDMLTPIQDFRVFDTRYDMDSFFRKKSRRLVDVCSECNLGVEQPELKNKSMTKMHKEYLENGNSDSMERLLTLNIRHSLSAILVYLCGLNGKTMKKEINVNSILHKTLKTTIPYVGSEEFSSLLFSFELEKKKRKLDKRRNNRDGRGNDTGRIQR